MAKYKKVNDSTIKIIVEKSNDIPLHVILQNQEQLLENKKRIEEALENIKEVLENAERLGITPMEKDKVPNKKHPVYEQKCPGCEQGTLKKMDKQNKEQFKCEHCECEFDSNLRML